MGGENKTGSFACLIYNLCLDVARGPSSALLPPGPACVGSSPAALDADDALSGAPPSSVTETEEVAFVCI